MGAQRACWNILKGNILAREEIETVRSLLIYAAAGTKQDGQLATPVDKNALRSISRIRTP